MGYAVVSQPVHVFALSLCYGYDYIYLVFRPAFYFPVEDCGCGCSHEDAAPEEIYLEPRALATTFWSESVIYVAFCHSSLLCFLREATDPWHPFYRHGCLYPCPFLFPF